MKPEKKQSGIIRLDVTAWSARLRHISHMLVYAVIGMMAFFTIPGCEIIAKLTPVDFLIGFTAGVWGLALILDWRAFAPSLKKLGRYWPVWLYALWTVVSAFFAEEPKLAFVKVFQTLEYFVVTLVLLHDFFLADKQRVFRAARVVLWVLVVNLVFAAGDYWGTTQKFDVRGCFKHSNVFGGFVAMLAPVCFGVMCYAKNWWQRAGLATLVAASLFLTLAGAAYVAMLLAIAGIAAVRGKGWFLATGAAIVLWQVALTQMGEREWLPRNNVMEHLNSVALYEEDGQPAPRYPEWQAAAWMIAEHPVVGVGPGNYQRKIGSYFMTVPRSARDKNESDVEIQNQYLVLAATTGLPGLLAFLAMVIGAVRAVLVSANDANGHEFYKGLQHGLVAGLLAFCAVLVWHPLLIRGIGLVFVAMLAACHALCNLKVEN